MKKIQHSIKSGRIKYLYGYTSAVAFARYVKARQVVLEESMSIAQCLYCYLEMCVEKTRCFWNKPFGVPIINEYGASELDIIAFTAANGDWEIVSRKICLLKFWMIRDKQYPMVRKAES
ncbi:MAG: hypothetical protein R2778_04915 [Saprospiraceae bacterium]